MELRSAVGLGLAATAYAAFLNTEQGKAFAQDYTWASVVIGTALVLLSLRSTLDRDAWNKVAGAFVVAGIPMIGRSLWNKYGGIA
jgi:hypothetical protein